MCEAKPGRRCGADTCPSAISTLERYAAAHPDGPSVTPLSEAVSVLSYEQAQARLTALAPRAADADRGLASPAKRRYLHRKRALHDVENAELAYQQAPADNNLRERIALEDAYQELTINDIAAAHPDIDVMALTPESAKIRRDNGVNAIVRLVRPAETFTTQDAHDAPVGTAVQASDGMDSYVWYKHAPDAWTGKWVPNGVQEYGNWTGHIHEVKRVITNDTLVADRERHHKSFQREWNRAWSGV